MSLKVRFSLILTVVFAASFILLGVSVFSTVKERLLLTAEQVLAVHLDREWRHLQSHGGAFSSIPEATVSEIYQRIYRDKEMVLNTLPEDLGEEKRLSHGFTGTIGSHRYEMLGYYDLRPTQRYLKELERTLFWRVLLSLLLLGPLCWGLTKFLIAPFQKLAKETSGIGAESLSFRFPEPARRDEYGILVRGFNLLMSRLDGSFQQIRRFATNASHELRTPITVVRGEAEFLLRRPRAEAEYRAGLERIVEHAESIQKTITRLLFFADLERMSLTSEKSVVPVAEKVQEIVRSLQPGSEKIIEIASGGVAFEGPSEILLSVVTNLLENALKYSREHVGVEFRKENGGLLLEVGDDGPGVPAGERGKLCEPFFKLSGAKAGHGLGLSIVKACVDAVRGKLEFGESKWGGLKVHVWIPQT